MKTLLSCRTIVLLVLIVLIGCDAQRFEGKSVLITGGSSGIGKATAKLFAAECVKTIHLVARAFGQLEAARMEIESVPRTNCSKLTKRPHGNQQGVLEPTISSSVVVFTHAVDMTNLTQVKEMMEVVPELDIAVNAAGIGGYLANLNDVPDNIWFGTYDSIHNNIYATLFGMQTQVQKFLAQNLTSAAIINLSSYQGHASCPGCAMYSASKHAIIGLTKSVALEVASTGIRVNAIAPGLIETPLTWNQARQLYDPPIQPYQCYKNSQLIDAKYTCDEGCDCDNIKPDDPLVDVIRKGFLPTNPMKRLGQPEEIGRVVLHLASDEASYVTGFVYDVTGGDGV